MKTTGIAVGRLRAPADPAQDLDGGVVTVRKTRRGSRVECASESDPGMGMGYGVGDGYIGGGGGADPVGGHRLHHAASSRPTPSRGGNNAR